MNLIPQLEAYRPRAAVTDGTWIEVKRAPGVRFLVKEPSSSNLRFMDRMLELVEFNDKGDFKSKVQMNRGQRQAFAETCIVGVEGVDLSNLANGSGVPNFAQALPRILEDYPDLLEELYLQAMDMANKAREELEDTLKNFDPPSPGG